MPEGVPFTQDLQQRLLSATPLDLWLSLVSLLVKDMTVLQAVMEIQTITVISLVKRHNQPGHATPAPSPSGEDLLDWLLHHGVPRECMDWQPTKVLQDLYIVGAKRGHSQPSNGQPPPPPSSDQACGEKPPGHRD